MAFVDVRVVNTKVKHETSGIVPSRLEVVRENFGRIDKAIKYINPTGDPAHTSLIELSAVGKNQASVQILVHSVPEWMGEKQLKNWMQGLCQEVSKVLEEIGLRGLKVEAEPTNVYHGGYANYQPE